MKEQILKVLAEHPSARKREIAHLLHISHMKAVALVNELEEEGKIKSVYHHDSANLEFYDKYYLA